MPIKAKLRSTHNNYLTLPVLFIMISNHYPMTYAHPNNWLVLLAIIAISAFARHYFNLEHRGIKRPSILVISLLAIAVLAYLIMPPMQPAVKSTGFEATRIAEVKRILQARCTTCHSAAPTDDVFAVSPGGLTLDSLLDMQQWAPRIKARSVDSEDMPFLNKTGMTDAERLLVSGWIEAGAPIR